ncbi:hypothetical protein XELAEV_18024752mg [Xenopus laevis]|uniref:Uncharacterized protein n=1 Tax=Xenopus laevis TaxID=8355 RepID=A0A974D0M8_XENLA|nr:hypothetical protein XELAEV_18024752mg [Xenopus laevis]
MLEERSYTSTQDSSNTFAYTEADIDRIVASADTTITLYDSTENKDFHFQLLNLSKKELNLSLHSSTLVEYIKTKRIPHGLRVGLQPLGCITSKEFLTKWEGIWNKASLDAMVLTVEFLQPEITRTRSEITALKESFQTSSRNI